MIYAIKFLYSFILPPGLFLVMLLAITIRLWKRERASAIPLLCTTLLLYAGCTNYAGGLLIQSLEKRYSPPAQISGDSIVILGAGATASTPDVDGSGNLSGSAANRILTGARLHFKTGLPIILSGGQVFEDYGNEAEIARRQLIGLHVPAEKIIVENKSLNTEQNVQFVEKILRDNRLEKPILVTSAFHMERAALIFQKHKIEYVPYPSDYMVSKHIAFYLNQITPSASGMQCTGTAFKEYLGIIQTKL